MSRKLGWLFAAVFVAFFVMAQPAAAHNSLASSEPANGERLGAPPERIVLRFAKPAPVETASADLIDTAGVRTPLALTADPDPNTLVAGAPAPANGRVTVHWRLTGQDGHVLTDEITFNVTGGPASAAATTSGNPTPTLRSDVTAPDFVRSLLRIGGFLGMTMLGGVVVLAFIWRDGWEGVIRLRGAAIVGIGLVGLGAVGQLLVLGGDVAQRFPWPGWEAIGVARRTDAGLALLVRAVLSLALGAAVFARWDASPRLRWGVAAGIGVGLAGTFAWAGHARSMRWSWLGLPIDVVHHIAAATWLGGLLAVGALVFRHAEAPALLTVVRRYSTVAALAVGMLVATGVFQAIRLLGSPLAVVTTAHGRWLLVKVAILGLMLFIADVNRQRIRRRFGDVESAGAGQRFALRRAMLTESALGIVVLVVTAFLVVSTPGAANDAPADSPAAVGAIGGSDADGD